MHERKAAMRTMLRKRQRSLSAAQRERIDRAICDGVLQSAAYAAAGTVLAYCGVDWEIDTRPLLGRILADGKRLCLPRCVSAHEMALCSVRTMDELCAGKYGIPAPRADAPTLTAEEIDLALLPCVGADRMGHRLGQGGGYYDAFLSQYHGAAILLVRECAVIPAIPIEPHDRAVPYLLTERGMIRCGERTD